MAFSLERNSPIAAGPRLLVQPSECAVGATPHAGVRAPYPPAQNGV